jgi:transcriptional regulator with XRE-family HTH domain
MGLLRARLLSFGMSLGIGFLLIVSLVMSAALAASSSSELLRRRKISEAKRRLTADQVDDILQSPDDGAILADRLGISRSTVSKYRLGKLGAYRATNPWAALALGGARA